MKKSKRLEKIIEENRKFEKDSPYNFCDRWCERCLHEIQMRCSLYLDDLERRATCIAHGKDEDDPEITEQVLEAQFQGLNDKLQESAKKFHIDLDNIDVDEEDFDEEDRVDFENLPKEIQEHIKFVQNHPLDKTAESYCDKAHEFLKETYYDKKDIAPELKDDFEVIAWYHTLISAKLHRALCGFHEPACEGDISLCDSIAQFEICKKTIDKSINSLRKIKHHYPKYKGLISELIALLHNINSRIIALEESIE